MIKYMIVDKNEVPYAGAKSFNKDDLQGYASFLNATPNLGDNSERVPFRVVEVDNEAGNNEVTGG